MPADWTINEIITICAAALAGLGALVALFGRDRVAGWLEGIWQRLGRRG